ncbi:MAG: TetR/AcrR family transcriptional regulator [Eubacterium sp.]
MKKRDLRVQKTYMALFQAFRELIQEKSFESLTVRELCDKAMVRTATFYKHFSDKYDFFAFMVQELRDDMQPESGISSMSGKEYYLQLIRNGLTFLERNKALIQVVDSDNMMSIIAGTSRNRYLDELVRHLKQDQASGHSLAAEPEILAELLLGSMNQISRWWISNMEQCSTDELTGKLEEYVRRMIG